MVQLVQIKLTKSRTLKNEVNIVLDELSRFETFQLQNIQNRLITPIAFELSPLMKKYDQSHIWWKNNNSKRVK